MHKDGLCNFQSFRLCDPNDIALIGDILDEEQDQQIRDVCVNALRCICSVHEEAWRELGKVIKKLRK